MQFQDAQCLRIFIKESARWHHEALHEYIVSQARQHGLDGAIVFRAATGFGVGAQIHTNKILSLSEDMPMVVEVIDQADRIDAFLDAMADALAGCFLTIESVKSARVAKP